MKTDCIFCKIVKGELPGTKLYETISTIVIAPKKVESRGHLLVIPKKHYENIFDIPSKEFSKYMETVRKVCVKLKENYGADGVNILNASGKAAQQSIQHLHFHLIPRFDNDGVDAWPKFNCKDIGEDEVYEKIKDSLEEKKN